MTAGSLTLRNTFHTCFARTWIRLGEKNHLAKQGALPSEEILYPQADGANRELKNVLAMDLLLVAKAGVSGLWYLQ